MTVLSCLLSPFYASVLVLAKVHNVQLGPVEELFRFWWPKGQS